MTVGFWLLFLTVLGGVLVVVYLKWKRRQSDVVEPIEDTGSIIVEFSRAYPTHPIREILHTEDNGSAFLRIADGSVGLVQVSGNHTLATLLDPGSILVESAENDRTIRLHFSRTNIRDGAFTFASVADAAEVSLWLCGNFVPPDEKDGTVSDLD